MHRSSIFRLPYNYVIVHRKMKATDDVYVKDYQSTKKWHKTTQKD